MVEGDIPRSHLPFEISVVAYHQGDLGPQIPRSMLPEELEQAVFFAGDEDRQPLQASGIGESPLHAEAFGNGGKLAFELWSTTLEVGQGEISAHEEDTAFWGGAVLVGVDNVGALLEEEARDSGHDSGPVRAGDQQAPAIHVLVRVAMLHDAV
jgi:hypothetical protein